MAALFIDSHAHIDDRRLDARQIIDSMRADGLFKIITVGCDVSTSRAAVRLAEQNENVYAAAGIHPSDAKRAKDGDLEIIRELCSHKKVVAVGEFGLDYHYPDYSKKEQEYWCERQIGLLAETGLPAIIHLRDAYEDMRALILRNRQKFKNSAVMHCFSGSLETARFYADLGFYISFSGVITFANAAKYAPIIRALPHDRLLIETDCPYLAPEPFRGKTNQPKYVCHTAAKMAEILGESLDYVAKITTENTLRLFAKITTP